MLPEGRGEDDVVVLLLTIDIFLGKTLTLSGLNRLKKLWIRLRS